LYIIRFYITTSFLKFSKITMKSGFGGGLFLPAPSFYKLK